MANRKYERHPLQRPARVHLPQGEPLELYVKDISLGGAFVSTGEAPELHVHVEIEVQLDDAEPLSLQGEVVHVVDREKAQAWGGTPGFGVQFENLGDESNRRLVGYLDNLRHKLDAELKAATFDATLLQDLEAAHRNGELFVLLALEPHCDPEPLQTAARERSALLSSLLDIEGLTDPLRKRIIAARMAIQRAAKILSDRRKCATYMLRSELLSVDDLVAAFAPHPETWEALSKQWEANHEVEAQQARDLAEQAIQQAQEDPQQARTMASQALAHHPFLFELREQLEAWSTVTEGAAPAKE